MDVILYGGLIRGFQGLASASITLLIGLLIASILRYYLGPSGTKKLFGGESLRSLPQSWLVGMLLPVCSIGVLPIIIEMRRVGIRRGAITAFALSAPLFNPLSLLYGLTLSRPIVIIGFAAASLMVVTILGLIWDRFTENTEPMALATHSSCTDDQTNTPEASVYRSTHQDLLTNEANIIGLRRIAASFVFAAKSLAGETGFLTIIAIIGLVLLGSLLPHGVMQTSVEQGDLMAPLKMAAVAVPIYATPMLTMSQLGMMFDHGNSPGASFCLLLLGTGINLATIFWTAKNYGLYQTLVWLVTLFSFVVLLAYAINKPLIPPGVQPAGHTHAFDIYTNPLHQGSSIDVAQTLREVAEKLPITDYVGLITLALVFCFGIIFNTAALSFAQRIASYSPPTTVRTSGLHSTVSPRIVGFAGLAGLVLLSLLGCYAYYPKPAEVLEQMKNARVEVSSGALTANYEVALHWIPILDEWSRRLEVGSAIRTFELRPYQQAQTNLLRKKLETLEHKLEHEFEEGQHNKHDPDHDDAEELRKLVFSIIRTSGMISIAFSSEETIND